MPELESVARLPNELTDAVIDHLDFDSLLNAALVARSWRAVLARARPRPPVCAAGGLVRPLQDLLDRDADVFKYVRELHVVFSGGRLDDGARFDGDTLLEALLRLPLCEIDHLAFYSFPDNLSPAFNALLCRGTTVRSLHLVDIQSVDGAALIVSLNLTPNIKTIALLGGACLSGETIQVPTFAAQMQAHVPSQVLQMRYQMFLAPVRLTDLLSWILRAPRLRRCLNVVGLRSFTWGIALEEFVRSHNKDQLEAIMSSVLSFELIVDYEDEMLMLVRMLHAFQRAPTLQLTFECHPSNIELVVRLLERTDLDWAHLECLVLTPRLSNSAVPVPAQWALLDDRLSEAQFASLRSVVVLLKGAFFVAADAGDISHNFPRLRSRGILRVVRRPADATHNLFLPFVAEGECL